MSVLLTHLFVFRLKRVLLMLAGAYRVVHSGRIDLSLAEVSHVTCGRIAYRRDKLVSRTLTSPKRVNIARVGVAYAIGDSFMIQ